jgi:hypothetical protein
MIIKEQRKQMMLFLGRIDEHLLKHVIGQADYLQSFYISQS